MPLNGTQIRQSTYYDPSGLCGVRFRAVSAVTAAQSIQKDKVELARITVVFEGVMKRSCFELSRLTTLLYLIYYGAMEAFSTDKSLSEALQASSKSLSNPVD